MSQSGLDIQGHRGCAGLMPENTIPAFLRAVELGVTTIEMDIAVSMDGQLVISHEPWMSERICNHPDGKPVTKQEAKDLKLYRMKYAEIQSYDCGSRLNPDYPRQQKVNAVKPTLKMVARSIQKFAADNKYAIPRFNIEIKSNPDWYEEYTPGPQVFVELVVNELRRLGIEEQASIQSFDINVLEELNKISDRRFRISYLVRKGRKMQKHLDKLSFRPDIVSPHLSLINHAAVALLHSKGIKVIAWTVNTRSDLEKLIETGVDGIITDYPDIIKK